MQIGFTIFGKPMGKQRARTSFKYGKHHTYTPPQTANYERNVGINYKRLIRHKFSKGIPLEIAITAFYPIPKRASKKVKQEMKNESILPTVKPDCDNVTKIILYALNKIGFHDDSQVCDLHFKKRYGLTPKVIVKIKNIESEKEKQRYEAI